ncbi:unnamed protein product [Adineta steineri]|uniref:NAD(P)(+)--arginine ADP-ribosyltransferase n=1 Tax=Adineta steineri TaxID=433720 RepID=A0A815PW32_9BILA|nr:unnamed protein product [Adineta steineri]CAF3846626.1 unnamed protein product [Adineta steineri]
MNWLKKTFGHNTNGDDNGDEMINSINTYKTYQISYDRSIQNFRLIWLDSSIDEINNDACINIIKKLREIVNTIQVFKDVNACIDFITDIDDDNIFIISSGTLGQIIIPMIHDDITQINSFYIFCQNKDRHLQWAQKWSKVKGIFIDIEPMCEALKYAFEDCDRNSVSMSFLQTTDEISNINLNQLDSSFMYIQILKDILLTIDFRQEDIEEFLRYCRKVVFVANSKELRCIDNVKQLQYVDKIQQTYHWYRPIWWYTNPCFLYSMLNKALRMMEVDLIVKMGFFLRELHQDIARLHKQQYTEHQNTVSFFVYRGQRLSKTEFNQLNMTQGGLLSFNNFLSTSTTDQVALKFVRKQKLNLDEIGVLFVIQVDPSKSSIPFANVRDVSFYPKEDEILFCMNSIFRIGEIKKIDDTINNRLWKVDLTLTNENDPQLHALTEYIRRETFMIEKGWYRLSNFLIILGETDKAEEICNRLLDKTTDQTEKASIYHTLGMIKYVQQKYQEAIGFYKQSIKIKEKIYSSNHLYLASSYSNIGEAYNRIGKYTDALSFHRKALLIKKETFPLNHPALAQSYDNIGSALGNLSIYSQALAYYEKALEIKCKTLPSNHPDLAQSYNNIGWTYEKMREYPKALLSHETALSIKKRVLPSKHLSLADSYKNIGAIYINMKQYSTALSFYNNALDILRDSLPKNHPSLLNLERNIECIKKKL